MSYQKFKADYLFNGYQLLDHQHVLITDENGKVIEIIDEKNAGDDIQHFNGILSPGFINCHCHLELSHMKNLIPEKTGLVDFVFNVVTQRHFPEEEILDAITKAEDEMIANGIVAVGDICNNTLTLPQKLKQRIAYYNFIELSGWLPQVAEMRFTKSKEYYDAFCNLSSVNCQSALAPHAPYSVSNKLWKLMKPYFKNKTTTIHNQETSFEDNLFINGSGDFIRMYDKMNLDHSFFQPTGKSSLQSYAYKLSNAKQIIFVHNTFTKKIDIEFLTTQPYHNQQFFYCLCVNANTYIENAFPPISLFLKYQCTMVIGTDSLASNWSLSILDEIKTIKRYYPNIAEAEILQWATLNGAKALQMDNFLGSFEKDKRPGVVLIENLENNKIGSNATIKKVA